MRIISFHIPEQEISNSYLSAQVSIYFCSFLGGGRRDEGEDIPTTERRALFCSKSPANKPDASMVKPACHIRTPNADVDGRTQKRGINEKHRNTNANSTRNRIFLQNAKSPLGCQAPGSYPLYIIIDNCC